MISLDIDVHKTYVDIYQILYEILKRIIVSRMTICEGL